jgi:hypothetical protein
MLVPRACPQPTMTLFLNVLEPRPPLQFECALARCRSAQCTPLPLGRTGTGCMARTLMRLFLVTSAQHCLHQPMSSSLCVPCVWATWLSWNGTGRDGTALRRRHGQLSKQTRQGKKRRKRKAERASERSACAPWKCEQASGPPVLSRAPCRPCAQKVSRSVPLLPCPSRCGSRQERCVPTPKAPTAHRRNTHGTNTRTNRNNRDTCRHRGERAHHAVC